MVGSSSIGPDVFSAHHAFRWEGGTMTDLGTLGGGTSSATGNNERGDAVVGWSQVAPGHDDTTHAVLWRAGRMIDLGTLGGSRSYATGVNDRYEVAGFSETATGQLHAFVWRAGRLIHLGTPAEQTSTATAINSRGILVGEVRAEMDSSAVPRAAAQQRHERALPYAELARLAVLSVRTAGRPVGQR